MGTQVLNPAPRSPYLTSCVLQMSPGLSLPKRPPVLRSFCHSGIFPHS